MKDPTPLPPAACALEAQRRRIRVANSILSSLDAEERWGNPNSARRDEMDREAAAQQAVVQEAEATLNLEVSGLRSSQPEVLEAWIAAREALLEAYLASLPPAKRVERYVATEEQKAWQQVREGTTAFVKQNGSYVHPPRLLYQQFFGFDP